MRRSSFSSFTPGVHGRLCDIRELQCAHEERRPETSVDQRHGELLHGRQPNRRRLLQNRECIPLHSQGQRLHVRETRQVPPDRAERPTVAQITPRATGPPGTSWKGK